MVRQLRVQCIPETAILWVYLANDKISQLLGDLYETSGDYNYAVKSRVGAEGKLPKSGDQVVLQTIQNLHSIPKPQKYILT